MKKKFKCFSILFLLVLGVLSGCSATTEPVNHVSTSTTSSTNTSVSPKSNTNSSITTNKNGSSQGTVDATATVSQNQQSNGTDYSNLADLTYDGKNQTIILNDNHSTFSKEDLSLSRGNWQTFSNLDQYNRVGVANAMLSKSMMPTAKRERLYVNPTGWKNKQITVNGHREWLYNRSHLIGYQFTGENNNPKNLMTGTRSFNDPGMLIYEDKVAEYLKTTGNHVRYQVEPIFKGNELVARGVHMQAKSVEDNQLDFNVFIFNVEPEVIINYADGTSRLQ